MIFNPDQHNRFWSLNNAPPVAFMPTGRHTVRIVADPKSNLFASTVLHLQGKNRTVCKGREHCAICPVAEEILKFLKSLNREGEYRLIPNARKMFKIYMLVMKTDASSSKWQEGKIYCVYTPFKVARKLLIYAYDLMSRHGLEFIGSMVNPYINGRCFEIRFDKGAHGIANISIAPFLNSPPIGLGDWYRPLDEVKGVPDTDDSFNAVLEAANATLQGLRDEMAQFSNAGAFASTPMDEPY